MSGGWHACGCGCGYSHKVIDDRIICPHPDFLHLLGPGELFVLDPAKMCTPCLFELQQVLEAAAGRQRQALSKAKTSTLAGLDAALEEFREHLGEVQIEAMLAEGGAVWERET